MECGRNYLGTLGVKRETRGSHTKPHLLFTRLSLSNTITRAFSSHAMSAPSRAEVLHLFRSLLRTAKQFTDYNIREYAKRRTIDGFRQNKTLTEASSVASVFGEGKSQLEVAKRQAVVYSLYAPKFKSIMET